MQHVKKYKRYQHLRRKQAIAAATNAVQQKPVTHKTRPVSNLTPGARAGVGSTMVGEAKAMKITGKKSLVVLPNNLCMQKKHTAPANTSNFHSARTLSLLRACL